MEEDPRSKTSLSASVTATSGMSLDIVVEPLDTAAGSDAEPSASTMPESAGHPEVARAEAVVCAEHRAREG